jgi:hypothetical protein
VYPNGIRKPALQRAAVPQVINVLFFRNRQEFSQADPSADVLAQEGSGEIL